MVCIVTFQAGNRIFTRKLSGSLEDCTIDASCIAEDKGWELLGVDEE